MTHRAAGPLDEWRALLEASERFGVAPEDGTATGVDLRGQASERLALTLAPSSELRRWPFGSFEEMMTSRAGFGLDTASPVQRALQRAVEGRALGRLWQNPDVKQAFGGEAAPAAVKPDEVYAISGIRSGKSLHAAGGGVYMGLTCSMQQTSGRSLGPGEIPRVSVISIRKDLAQVTFSHIVGNCLRSPELRKRIIGEPTADAVLLMHPSGRPVEIKVVAGSRAGATLVARWSAGVIFDEAPRMLGQEDGVINLDDARSSVRFRLLDGAQIWYVGSPWEPRGPCYDAWKKHHGGGLRTTRILVIKATSSQMNPEHWPESKIKEAYATDPDIAAIELGAEFASPEATLLPHEIVERAAREMPAVLPYEDGLTYVAAMDPATRSNGWTFVVMTKKEGRLRVVLAKEWRSYGEPLRPQVVMEEIAEICREYRIETVLTDQWSGDALRDFGLQNGLFVVQLQLGGREKMAAYMSMVRRLEAGLMELSPTPELLRDLSSIKRRTTSDGFKIVLPLSADGRHADYAPAVVLAAGQYLEQKPEEQRSLEQVAQEIADDDDRAVEELEAGMWTEQLEELGFFAG